MTAKHTPTPWEAKAPDTPDYWHILDADGHLIATLHEHPLDDEPYTHEAERARLIVHRVNVHDALVEALDTALAYILAQPGEDAALVCRHAEARDLAVTALRLAREEE